MKVLHIDSSVQGGASFSREMSAAVLNRLREAHPDASVVYRDFGNDPVPHLTEASLPGVLGLNNEGKAGADSIAASKNVFVEEYMAADITVIGAALYNLSVSSSLKAWIDHVVLNERTFRLTAEGTLEGLMGDKRAIVCVSRGGFYNEGSPGAAVEYCESYLRAIFGYIGVTNLDVIAADGVAISADLRDVASSAVNEKIQALKF